MSKALKFVVVAMMLATMAPGLSANPKCDGPNNWAAMMAFAHLKNAGVTDNAKIDFNQTIVNRIASEKIGEDLFRQVHRVIYIEKSGKKIELITTNDASSEECSMSAVEVYVVERKLGG